MYIKYKSKQIANIFTAHKTGSVKINCIATITISNNSTHGNSNKL